MEQKIKSLKGELDHSLGNDLFERIHAHDTSSPLSDTDASWIQVTVNDPSDRSSDDDASWVTAGDQNLENHRKSLDPMRGPRMSSGSGIGTPSCRGAGTPLGPGARAVAA